MTKRNEDLVYPIIERLSSLPEVAALHDAEDRLAVVQLACTYVAAYLFHEVFCEGDDDADVVLGTEDVHPGLQRIHAPGVAFRRPRVEVGESVSVWTWPATAVLILPDGERGATIVKCAKGAALEVIREWKTLE